MSVPLPNPPPATVPVSPALVDILVQASQRFDELMAEVEDVDRTPLQTHVDTLSSLPPSVVYSKISVLEKLALNLGFEEADEMRHGRELDVFGAAPPAVAEILAQVPSASAAAALTPQQQAAQYHALKSALGSLHGGNANVSLLAALQQQALKANGDQAAEFNAALAAASQPAKP